MAKRLKLYFTGTGNRKINMILPYAADNPAGADVKALMSGIIANGDIYSDEPLAIVKAELLDSFATSITLP